MGGQPNRLSDSLQEAGCFLRTAIREDIPTATQQLQKTACFWMKQRAPDTLGAPKPLWVALYSPRHFLQFCLIAHFGSAIRETHAFFIFPLRDSISSKSHFCGFSITLLQITATPPVFLRMPSNMLWITDRKSTRLNSSHL